MTFPTNAIDIFVSVPQETVKYTIVNSTTPKTILGFDLVREKIDKNSQLWCDNNVIFDWSINSTENFEFSNIQCSQPIYLTNNTTKPQGLHLIYTDYNLSSTVENTIVPITDGSNTFYVNNTWTNGELILTFLFFVFFLFQIFKFGFEFFFPKIIQQKKYRKD